MRTPMPRLCTQAAPPCGRPRHHLAALLLLLFLLVVSTNSASLRAVRRGHKARASLSTRVSTLPDAISQRSSQLEAALQRVRSGQAQVLFHHLKKSGGTALCDHVAAHGVYTWSCSRPNTTVASMNYPHDSWDIVNCNCNGGYEPHRGPFSLRKGAALREVLRTYSTTEVFFNEGPVSDEPIWLPELVQFAIVRHPLPRLLSQLLHAASLASEALFQDILREPNTLIREILINQTLPARYFRPGTTEWFSPDSYITRVFAGTSVDASRRRLYTLDLQLAVDNLDRMDAVLLYEEMLKEPSSSLVSELLGGLPPMTAQRKTGRATSFSSQHSAQVVSKLNNGTMGMLFEYLEFDFRLYEHCKLLHNVTLAAYESLRDRRSAATPEVATSYQEKGAAAANQ